MRTTIEDIIIQKTFYKRERDAFGNRTKEPYEKSVRREVQLVTGWPRFGHYIIDSLIIGVILVGISFLIPDYNFSISRPYHVSGIRINLIPSLDTVVITAAYYFICEKIMQRTIGKFVTDAVVINQYAESPDVGSLIGRSFARLVPFEALSCLGDRGWHDRWSNTYVVTTAERNTLKKLLNQKEGIFISDREDILD